ncbi:hypothetical protein, partial [Pseudomonas huaxiensis]|uniref:hypothetical protein n=1 Tax=Pseudomonas huaxiensis TaxID=2213017 RepID=UPI001CDB4D76
MPGAEGQCVVAEQQATLTVEHLIGVDHHAARHDPATLLVVQLRSVDLCEAPGIQGAALVRQFGRTDREVATGNYGG